MKIWNFKQPGILSLPFARNDLKVDKGTVGEALNHVDKENRMTDLYIKKDFSVINDVNSRVIDYVFNPDMMKG